MNASRIVVLLHQLSLTGAPRLTLDALTAMRADASIRIVSWEGGPLVDAARHVGPTAVLRPGGPGRAQARRGRLVTDGVVQVFAGAGSRFRTTEQAAVLRQWRPQLVYVSSVEALPMVGALRLGKVPTVLHVHELGTALKWFERKRPGLIRGIPDRYVAVSEAVARELVSEAGVAGDAITVVPPYVLPPFDAARPAPRAAAAGAPLIVGGAGNPSWLKGIDLWLLAARQVVDRLGPDKVRFVWVGYRDNEDGMQFRAKISRLNLAGNVELVPETDRPYDQFARFDVFAMTSWEESASLVVLEAMSLGVPVICFAPTGGPAEEVGTAGIVIPEMSPSLMAGAIVDLAGSAARRLAIGKAGAERAREFYRRDISVAGLISVFDAAVPR